MGTALVDRIPEHSKLAEGSQLVHWLLHACFNMISQAFSATLLARSACAQGTWRRQCKYECHCSILEHFQVSFSACCKCTSLMLVLPQAESVNAALAPETSPYGTFSQLSSSRCNQSVRLWHRSNNTLFKPLNLPLLYLFFQPLQCPLYLAVVPAVIPFFSSPCLCTGASSM